MDRRNEQAQGAGNVLIVKPRQRASALPDPRLVDGVRCALRSVGAESFPKGAKAENVFDVGGAVDPRHSANCVVQCLHRSELVA